MQILVNDGLGSDIMHDVLEGVLTLTTKLLLQHFILQEKMLTVELLNSRVSSLKYGSADGRNKPSKIGKNVLSSKDNLTQSGITHKLTVSMMILVVKLYTASQTWCLDRLFRLSLVIKYQTLGTLSPVTEHYSVYVCTHNYKGKIGLSGNDDLSLNFVVYIRGD